jgi:hypothetical protein
MKQTRLSYMIVFCGGWSRLTWRTHPRPQHPCSVP